MKVSTKKLGKNVSFMLEFYGKKLEIRNYKGVVDAVLIDVNLGAYGYVVNYFDSYDNKEKTLKFIDKKIVDKNHIGEDLKFLNIHE